MLLIIIVITRETILSKVAPQLFPQIAPTVEYLAPAVPVPIPSGINRLITINNIFITINNCMIDNRLQLRCVIGVLRHGDRTPKQKMKMIVRDPIFFKLFSELGGYKKGTLKLKKPKDLQVRKPNIMISSAQLVSSLLFSIIIFF